MESLVSQTMSDIEIIPVDDGSPDACGKILDEFASMDKRVKPIHQENGGYGSAVNSGLELASGAFIGIVEADDYVEPGMFETLWNLASRFDTDIARCGYNVLTNGSVAEVVSPTPPENAPFNIRELPEFLVSPPAIWSAIYRKQFLENHGIRVVADKGISYQDVDFFVRTTILADKLICTMTPLYNYRLDNPSSSTNSGKKINDIFVSYRATDNFIESALSKSDKIRAYYTKRKICDLHWHFRRLGRSPEQRYYFANKASKYLEPAAGDAAVIALLSSKQKLFFSSITRYPRLYTFYKNNEPVLGLPSNWNQRRRWGKLLYLSFAHPVKVILRLAARVFHTTREAKHDADTDREGHTN